MVYGSRLDGKAISRWPCAAYASANPADGCTGEGKSRCSKCRLVSYCSPTCQSSHWKAHKKQCNSSYLKNSWTTQWQREARLPSFVRLTDGSGPKYDHVGNTSHYVWGNVFAYDCLNTAHNEGEAARSQDFTICFAASGDLRNTMMTVNSLPEDYSGKCRILLNDRDTVVAGRNAFLLHVLQHADQMDIDELAELCTHVMYSAALTEPQHDAVMTGLESIFRHAPGDGMPIVGTQGRMHINIFLHKILDMSRSTFNWPTARQKRHDVVLNPSRVDFLHRAIWPLRPAHRAAEMHYFQTGIVLPFGAPTDHFTYPNRLLFDANAEWLPPDETRLLSGWDPRAVIASGAQHGCPAEDIYGCIFFHVRAQFAELARRMQRMHVEFGVTSYDATLLSSMLAKGYRPLPSAPSPHRFDRVETSNIMDFITNAERIVETWAPLLNRANPHAALLMHTINWGESTPDASPTSEAATMRLYPRAFEYSGFTESPKSDFLHPLHFTAMLWLDSFYDHEAAYEAYLRRIRVKHVAARAGLKLKDRNSITPKRLGFSLEGSPDNVPHFSKEEWYLLVILAKRPTIHRYLELAVAYK